MNILSAIMTMLNSRTAATNVVMPKAHNMLPRQKHTTGVRKIQRAAEKRRNQLRQRAH